MKLISDMKQLLILNDFPTVNETIAQNSRMFLEVQENCDKMLVNLRDELATDLFELEEEYYSSTHKAWTNSSIVSVFSMSSLSDILQTAKDSYTVKVSSVLNRNVKEFGKKFLLDGREDTCWNSDQGSPQYIQIVFNDNLKINIAEIRIMFQGGFAGKECQVEVNGYCDKKLDFHPEDNNKLQCFPMILDQCSSLKIVFNQSSDFFGRITIYQLQILTSEATTST